jgi:hypothetical protein
MEPNFYDVPITEDDKDEVEEPAPAPGAITIPDLEALKRSLVGRYGPSVDNMKAVADSHRVIDDESEVRAIEMIAQAKKLTKAIDDKRKVLIKDADEFVRGINGLCNSLYKATLADIVTTLKGRAGEYAQRKELERRKREKAKEDALKRAQEVINQEAAAAGVEAPIVAPMPPEKKETTVRTAEGTSSTRLVWKMTGITDFSKVPDEWKTLDTQKVNAAIKAGVREIPGITIEEVPEMSVRMRF